MPITFANESLLYDGDDLAVHFAALVDGEPIVCSITAEALEDHFGAKSPREEDLLDAFSNGAARIRAVCAEALDENGGQPVVLRSGLFRVTHRHGARVSRLAAQRGAAYVIGATCATESCT